VIGFPFILAIALGEARLTPPPAPGASWRDWTGLCGAPEREARDRIGPRELPKSSGRTLQRGGPPSSHVAPSRPSALAHGTSEARRTSRPLPHKRTHPRPVPERQSERQIYQVRPQTNRIAQSYTDVRRTRVEPASSRTVRWQSRFCPRDVHSARLSRNDRHSSLMTGLHP